MSLLNIVRHDVRDAEQVDTGVWKAWRKTGRIVGVQGDVR